VDKALMSRADWIEDVGLPSSEARAAIIADTLEQLASAWPRVADLRKHTGAFVAASEGMDGRRLRKALVAAAARSIETAQDMNKLKADDVLATLKEASAALPQEKAA
jgi:hypothetical protein